jgi:hypothetical protein
MRWSRNLDKKALMRVFPHVILGKHLGVAVTVKKNAYGLTLAFALLFSAAAGLSLVDLANADQPSPIPTNATATPTINATITKSGVQIEDFHYTSWDPGPVFPLLSARFNVTIPNFTDEDIDGLTLEVKMFDANGSKMSYHTVYGNVVYENESYPLGRLYAKESRTITGTVISSWGAVGVDPLTTIICVKSGDTVLAEYDYPPSPTPEPQPSPSPEPEPFPTALVIAASGAAVAIVSLVLIVYFKKRKH